MDAPSQSYTFDGSTNLFADTTYGGWSDLRFDQPIVAFGAWFTGINPINRPYSKIDVDADSLSGYGSYSHIGSYLPPTTSGGAAQFIGFTSSQAFNRIIFSGVGCCYSSFAVDNVVHAAALAPVPEPETLRHAAGRARTDGSARAQEETWLSATTACNLPQKT